MGLDTGKLQMPCYKLDFIGSGGLVKVVKIDVT